jgi:hypothetical protein
VSALVEVESEWYLDLTIAGGEARICLAIERHAQELKIQLATEQTSRSRVEMDAYRQFLRSPCSLKCATLAIARPSGHGSWESQ